METFSFTMRSACFPAHPVGPVPVHQSCRFAGFAFVGKTGCKQEHFRVLTANGDLENGEEWEHNVYEKVAHFFLILSPL